MKSIQFDEEFERFLLRMLHRAAKTDETTFEEGKQIYRMILAVESSPTDEVRQLRHKIQHTEVVTNENGKE